MKFYKIWDRFGIYILTLIVLFGFAIAAPSILSGTNINNMFAQMTMTAIAGAGMTFCITSGGFDLSVGSILSMTAVFIAQNMKNGMMPGIAILLAFGIAAVFGVFNGLVITKIKVPTFITTLATMKLFKGFALLYSQGKPTVLTTFTYFKWLTQGRILGINVSIWIMAIVFVIAFLVYFNTKFGVNVRAIGSNEQAARLSGVNVNRVLIAVFVITAITAAIAGLLYCSQLLKGEATLGDGFELDVICVTVVGGTSLAGGRGKIIGTLVAAFLVQVIRTGINLLGFGEATRYLFLGGILLIVIAINGLQHIKEKSIDV